MLYCSKKRSSCGGGLRNVGVYVYVNPFRYFLDEREVETLAETAAESFTEEGIAQGARQMSIENTLTVLTGRFPGADVSLVESRLEAIEDLTKLPERLRLQL